MQAIFSQAMDVGSIVTQLDGRPLTRTSNSCAFCDLILSTREGFERCMGSWRALAEQEGRRPQLSQCHAGLLYARGRIEVEDEFVAMVFAGQVVVDRIEQSLAPRINALAEACGLDPAQLRQALPSVRYLEPERSELLIRLLERMGETLADIGRERLVLLRKLQHIAQVTNL
jgi:ligand-binding sensor protein